MTKDSNPVQTPAKTRKAPNSSGSSSGKTPPAKATKSDMLIALLSRPNGATIATMMAATGWQAHSVRGFLAGTVKKQLGKPVSSEKTETGRVYRIDAGGAA